MNRWTRSCVVGNVCGELGNRYQGGVYAEGGILWSVYKLPMVYVEQYLTSCRFKAMAIKEGLELGKNKKQVKGKNVFYFLKNCRSGVESSYSVLCSRHKTIKLINNKRYSIQFN